MNIGNTDIKKAYFIGIGGIGMSALAQFMKDHGVAVYGSDREGSPVTELLHEKGITVIIGQREENIPADTDVAIYSEAVWTDNPERVEASRRAIPQLSYFEALGQVTETKKTIAVAGTHGKTTTTGMLARVLRDAQAPVSAVVGSIVKDFGSNYLPLQAVPADGTEWFAVEACEYKRDFLTLSPHVLVVTNIEFDHTDYYADLADVQSAFRALMEKVPEDGTIVTDLGNSNIAPLLEGLACTIIDYTEEPAFTLKLPGDFNVANAKAAAAAAKLVLPISDEALQSSLGAFSGTWRRFEYKGTTASGVEVYDDYAHHPTAVKKTLSMLKEQLRAGKKGKLFVAFHPHLYSRTRDLLDDFTTAFESADRILIAPIYAAREADDGTMSNTILAERIKETGKNARALTFEEIQTVLEKEPKEGDVIITMGAGDIYKIADALTAKPEENA